MPKLRSFVALIVAATVTSGVVWLTGTTPAAAGNDITGVVRSDSGPEAGVWVIAETEDLETVFRKIVVTDDDGRFLLPDLPDATYEVWARGYGLVDSPSVTTTPGGEVELAPVTAKTPQDAAKIYPANYWYSLLEVPPESDFPRYRRRRQRHRTRHAEPGSMG